MEFRDVLARRHSCRAYLDKPMEREKLAACLEAGRLSPSSCNTQKWMFVAVDDQVLCAGIARAAEDHDFKINLFTNQIPAFIAIVKYPPRTEPKPYQKIILSTLDHSLLDIGCAAQQICLQAADLGLGSVMLGWFDRDRVKTLLGIPQELELTLLIGLGYEKNEGMREPKRHPAKDVIRWNGWSNMEK